MGWPRGGRRRCAQAAGRRRPPAVQADAAERRRAADELAAVRLHRLQVTAFGPFAGTEEVDFDALASGGLFLLHGPTGAGKTSVLDAVCFALYGAVPGAARQARPAAQRPRPAERGRPEVALEFTAAGRPARGHPVARVASARSGAAPARPRSRPGCSSGSWRGAVGAA